MKASLRRKAIVMLVAFSGGLAACNAILGVEDVTLGTGDGGASPRDDDGTALKDGEVPPPLEPLEGGVVGTTIDGGPTLSVGFNHTCARMLDSTVRCWGNDNNGQLGDGVPLDGGPRPDALKPQSVPGIDDAIAVGSGASYTCIVRKPGAVFCWGANNYGQLGNGTNLRSSSPIAVSNVQDAVAVAGGFSFACALLKNATVMCWGANYSGQLGDGLKTNRSTAALVSQLTNVASIAAATDHACAVLTNGDVMCWGRNAEGQLGNGSLTESLTPTKLSSVTEIVQIATASRFSCVLQKSGRVYCWGRNDFGQLGNGTANAASYSSPVLVPSFDDATFLWAGNNHACAVRRSGAVVCWGRAGNGQLGGGTVLPDASTGTPGAVLDVTAASAVWTGGDRSCVLTQDGRTLCWGLNNLGQLGNGTTENAYTAVPVTDFP